MSKMQRALLFLSLLSSLSLPGWLCSPPSPVNDAASVPAHDAASLDSAANDVAALDAVRADAQIPDAGQTDSHQADSATPDATTSDDAISGNGRFTGEALSCTDFTSLLDTTRSNINNQFDPAWFDNYNNFIDSYENDDGELDPDAGRRAVAMAAILDDNVYPYCVPVLDLAKEHPGDPMVLNDAAVCLLYLEDWAGAGRLLDCAYALDPALPLTLENASVWYDRQGQVDAAIETKAEACSKAPEPSHCNHSGEFCARDHGRDAATASFHSGIASNYPWDNGDGSSGGDAAARTALCCNCNDTMYDDVMVCVDQCQASLGCFTAICDPGHECCNDKSPFSLGVQVCVPPGSPIQACIGADTTGNLDISVQGTLANVVSVGVRGRISFGGSGAPSTSVGVYTGGSAGGGSAGVDLDLPSGKVSNSVGVSLGGVGFTLGLPDANGWAHIARCGL